MDNDEWQQLTGENMTDETRKDYEEEKLKETYVPGDSLMQLADNLIKDCDKVLEENKKTIENLDKEFDDMFKDPEYELNMLKLEVANLTIKHKIDLAIYCFKEASKESKK